MNLKTDGLPSEREGEKVRKLASWTAKYACHRTAGPFLARGILNLSFFFAFFGLSALAGRLLNAGQTIAFWACVGALAAVAVLIVLYAFTPWGHRLPERWGTKLFASDGHAATRSPEPRASRLTCQIVSGLFGACVIGTVVLGYGDVIPGRYAQPITALYVVPFMAFIGWARALPGAAGHAVITTPVMWLWPTLYALYTILVLAEAPVFGPVQGPTHIIVAMCSTMFVTGFVAYIQSRLTLRKLKSLSRVVPASQP